MTTGGATGVTTSAGVGTTTAGAVGTAVGAGGPGAATTRFETVAWQMVSAPPPFAEPLHWSMFTASVVVVVDVPSTEQVKPTLVPPLPEPLHCPTVAALTEVTPGVFTGVQVPGAPVPVIVEPTHW